MKFFCKNCTEPRELLLISSEVNDEETNEIIEEYMCDKCKRKYIVTWDGCVSPKMQELLSEG